MRTRRTTWKTTLQTLAAVATLWIPAQALADCNVSGDYPFTVIRATLGNAPEACLICFGPNLRESPFIEVRGLAQNQACTWYAAEQTFVFPPGGKWSCEIHRKGADPIGCNSLNQPMARVDFCAGYAVFPRTTLVVTESNDYTLTSDHPATCKTAEVRSFLGDSPKQESGNRDADTFLLAGTGGDQVTVRLEPDPRSGNNGGQAVLRIRGKSLKLERSGTLPIELVANLPATTDYEITIEEGKGTQDDRYRGAYFLRIQSAAVDFPVIRPTATVEK